MAHKKINFLDVVTQIGQITTDLNTLSTSLNNLATQYKDTPITKELVINVILPEIAKDLPLIEHYTGTEGDAFIEKIISALKS